MQGPLAGGAVHTRPEQVMNWWQTHSDCMMMKRSGKLQLLQVCVDDCCGHDYSSTELTHLRHSRKALSILDSIADASHALKFPLPGLINV